MFESDRNLKNQYNSYLYKMDSLNALIKSLNVSSKFYITFYQIFSWLVFKSMTDYDASVTNIFSKYGKKDLK